MDEETRRQVAIFRFGVIHDFVGGVRLDHGERERLVKQKAGRKYEIPFSPKTRLSRSTILRWVSLYQQGGGRLQSLYPGGRSDEGKSRAMDEETACALIGLRKELPRATVSFLIHQMEKRGLATPGAPLSPTTVWRFLNRQGLMHLGERSPEDRRKPSFPMTSGRVTRCMVPWWKKAAKGERPIFLLSWMISPAWSPMPNSIWERPWTHSWMPSGRPC